jgi:hypothetical protein
MALMTCHECGNQVSASAKACPQCGAKGKALIGPPVKKQIGTTGKVVIGGVVAMLAIGGMLSAQSHSPAPEQQTEHDANDRRNTNIVLYAKSLQAAARNPESVIFERVLANQDGTLTCFKYRAENGFGGTNREWAAFTPAGGATQGSAVKMICHDKVMRDVTAAAVPLIKLML